MSDRDWLAERFEENRARLRGVAYRMLGTMSDADDAVQEAWLRLSRNDVSGVGNLAGWLTTVVARVSLDMLRARRSRSELSLDAEGVPEPVVGRDDRTHPEHEATLADSVGLAMLVVLETLDPAERVAFVLHDMFAVPFDEIAPIVQRSPEAARQLASRARRRVQGGGARPSPDVERQRAVVDAFLAAARGGDFEALLAVLDPDVVLRYDRAPIFAESPREVRGAANVARRALIYRAREARPVLIDGAVGVAVAPGGRLRIALRFTIEHGRVVAIDAVGEPERLRGLELGVLDG